MSEQKFAILADGPDAVAVAAILHRHGHDCESLAAALVIERVREGRVAALFAAAELLAQTDIAALRHAIACQPPWSDLPIILLVDRANVSPYAGLMDELGQVRLVERPIDAFIVERAARAALRSRARQQGAREFLVAAREAERRLRELSETLEARVAERSAELRAAYAARLEAEERYRLAARATNDAIWDLDLLADRIRWSESASGFFGYGNVAPTPLAWWTEKVHPDDREQAEQSLAAAVEGGDAYWSASYRFRTAGGDYADVHDRGFIFRDGQGKAVRAVGAMADVTEQLRSDADRRRLEAELVHVSRLSAMGTMASTLAHELNQPLTAVASYVRGSRRLLEHLPGDEVARARSALEAAEDGAHRAGQIVRRLRDLVERGGVEIARQELPQLIEEAGVIGFVDENALGVGHRFQFDPAARWVEADRIQVQQVLINLIRNAVEAMRDQPRREVVIATASRGEMVEVSIADTGSGIAEAGESLFAPFQTSKEEGMGIGLSISRTIVEAHGGRIWAEDAPGGGALFRFTLPRANADADAAH